MLKEIFTEHIKGNQRGSFKHTDRYYPTQSSSYINYLKYKKLEGKCLRAAYYNCTGVPDEDEFSLEREMIFKIGDYTEQMLVDICKSSGILHDTQVKFTIDDFKIVGKVDAILKINNKVVGLEIKSIGGNSQWTTNAVFGSRWNDPFPKWQNLFQTLIYCYAFRDKIDKFILLYIRRDTCEIKEFEISIIPKDGKIYPVIDGKIDERFTVDSILERYSILQKYINKETVPPREYSPIYPKEHIATYAKLGIISKKQAEEYKDKPFGDRECSWCSYKEHCKKDV